MLNRWGGLSRFLEDGPVELSTNPAERAIRPIALGRKNHLLLVVIVVPTLGNCVLAGRDRQAQQGRALQLSHRCASTHGR